MEMEMEMGLVNTFSNSTNCITSSLIPDLVTKSRCLCTKNFKSTNGANCIHYTDWRPNSGDLNRDGDGDGDGDGDI